MSAATHIISHMSDLEKIDALLELLIDYQPRKVPGDRVIRQSYGTGREPLSHAKAKLTAMRDRNIGWPKKRPFSLSDRDRRELAFVLGILFSFVLITAADAERIGG